MKFWFEKGAWASKKAQRRIIEKDFQDIKNIAVIRHAALGDMVLTRPFLVEVRKNFPNATITLSLIRGYRYGKPEDLVDQLHVIPGYEPNQPKVSRLRKFIIMRELGYHDIIFDLAATNRSMWSCLLNPAWLKVGFPYRLQLGKFIYDAMIFRSDLKFEAEILLDMLNLLGCRTKYPPNFALPGSPLQRDKPYILYFAGGSVESKRWPAQQFAALISKMTKQYPDWKHIILEGTNPWESVDQLMSSLSQYQNVLAMKAQELNPTISLLKGAQLVISNDTGIRNLAIAAEIPTLGIFFSTVPFRYWPRYGYHDVVYQPDGGIPSVEAVFNAANTMIKKYQLDKRTGSLTAK